MIRGLLHAKLSSSQRTQAGFTSIKCILKLMSELEKYYSYFPDKLQHKEVSLHGELVAGFEIEPRDPTVNHELAQLSGPHRCSI